MWSSLHILRFWHFQHRLQVWNHSVKKLVPPPISPPPWHKFWTVPNFFARLCAPNFRVMAHKWTDKWMDGRYKVHYLPASQLIAWIPLLIEPLNKIENMAMLYGVKEYKLSLSMWHLPHYVLQFQWIPREVVPNHCTLKTLVCDYTSSLKADRPHTCYYPHTPSRSLFGIPTGTSLRIIRW